MLVGIGDDAAVVEPERNRARGPERRRARRRRPLRSRVHAARRDRPPRARRQPERSRGHGRRRRASRCCRSRCRRRCRSPTSTRCRRRPRGARRAASLHVAGGNLTRSPGPLDDRRHRRRDGQAAAGADARGGARPGDELYVSGTIGAAAAGLQMLASTRSRAEPAGTVVLHRPRRLACDRALSLARSRACGSACCSGGNRAASGVHGPERRPGRRRAADRRRERRRRDDRRRRAADRPRRARLVRARGTDRR